MAIDDFSRELYADIFPDKTQHSTACFPMGTVIAQCPMPNAQCPYQIDCAYSDNGTEFKGIGDHAFVTAFWQQGIGQKFTRVNRSKTNGKAERVINTLMDMWHSQFSFKYNVDLRIQLLCFINFCDTVKPHKGLSNATPYEIFTAYFSQPLCKQL